MANIKKNVLLMVPIVGSVLTINMAYAATSVSIGNQPLSGITMESKSNIFLALSVEFPTAGAAYNDNQLDPVELTTRYRGYFDPAKCYVVSGTNTGRYFEPKGLAVLKSGIYECNQGSTTNEYSGNVLNWATMSALDVYRSEMTGGNRALGVGTSNSAYEDGDTNALTYLRRARVYDGQNRNSGGYGKFPDRRVVVGRDQMKRLVPHDVIYNLSGGQASSLRTVIFDSKDFYVTVKHLGQNNAVVSRITNLPVVVQVCKPSLLENNCVAYAASGRSKPEGLMQNYRDKMNFASFGYLNIAGNNINGGVLRSKLASIVNEYNQNTGQFVINPFPSADSFGAEVTNSGSINYLNKFGDENGYKTNDPVAELYYTVLRYIRNKGYVGGNTRSTAWLPNNLTKQQKDNFPVIDFFGPSNDPFKNANGTLNPDTVCSPNTIMVIGDTNTHADRDLPGMGQTNSPTDDDIPTPEFIDKLKKAELAYIGAAANATFMDNAYNTGMGSSNSGAGLPALAYWANTENVRPDLLSNLRKPLNLKTFMIDVLENGSYKAENGNGPQWIRNSYYLAGKYGGFTDQNGDKVPNRDRLTEWTNDTPPGDLSISQYTWGTPKNFALANDPDSMVEALQKAFNSVQGSEDASQTGVATSVGADLFDIDNDRVVRASYKDSNWSGDVVGFQLMRGGNGSLEGNNATEWSANSLLRDNNNRRIFANNGSGVYEFTIANAGQFNTQLNTTNAANLIGYMRGETTNEGSAVGQLRPRSGDKLGTVVNSQVVSIPTPKAAPTGCTYADTATLARTGMYGFASNDGMYHMLDADGREIYAYIPSTALSKLNAYATNGYQHQYINDGLSTYAEVCYASGDGGARSVVVGSTGRGGRSIYALDVTNLSNPGANNTLWEFSATHDSDFGHFIGKPVLTKDRSGKPVVVVTSGYNGNSNNGYLYVLDVNKTGSWVEGVNYQKIALGTGGVGSPFVYDADNNGIADAVYVGDLDGKLWKVNLTADNSWVKAFNGLPLFSVPNSDANNPGTGITATPFVQVTRGRLTVFFGTGRYLDETDFNLSSQNYAYGIFDTGEAITNPDTQLLNQTIDTTPVAGRNDLWLLSSNALEGHHLGWRITLRQGQMIVDQANVQSKRAVFFNVFTPMPAANCLVTSTTFLLGADVRSGAQYEEPLFDVNRDGVVDENDAVGGFFQLGEMLGPVGTMIQTEDGRVLYIVIGSDGQLHVLDLNPLAVPPSNLKYKRLSWREIF
ncbi:PilC beta-propeller domain-containing protein [Vitreoscilla sp. C1]|uniref:pilus assembly protein n=1 Tax=Vitreoscilla sp. (strain C1) TaxID=96942 RepID=UPI00148EC24B|nr:PilC/PilY family type IV pilus protein [Vitreoscilla sp. C1]AUZ03865.2 PilC beta-propeller domain-containing protein [Vitreoscilla sp. C1]